jgi:adenylyltransferase/sulfurtransferase
MGNRFARQLNLAGFGPEAQEKLKSRRVLIVGCGGLGCPSAMYLVRSGLVHIGLIDEDLVSETNLHRQVLFNESDIGKPKAETAKARLLEAYSEAKIEVYNHRLNAQNWEGIVSNYDIVLDCTDNFSSRYLINDVCVHLNKPLVYGAANQYEGQVTVFNYKGSGQLRDLFPEIPKPGIIQNCEVAGVLGVVTGIVGQMMALETIKLITGVGEAFANKLWLFDALSSNSHIIKYKAGVTAAVEPPKRLAPTVYSWQDQDMFQSLFVVDVRTREERNTYHRDGIHVPLDELPEHLDSLKSEDVVFYCQSGKRALQAAEMLLEAGAPNVAYINDVLA